MADECATFWCYIVRVIWGFPGGVVAGVTLMTSIEWILQRIFAAPKLYLQCEQIVDDDGASLTCIVGNMAIENRFLRWLRIRRDEPLIYGTFDIYECGMNKLIANDVPIRFNEEDGNTTGTITLRGHIVEGFNMIIRYKDETWINNGDKQIPIERNRYRALIRIYYEDNKFLAEATFLNTQKLEWDVNPLVVLKES